MIAEQEKILVVDDEEAVRNLLKRTVESAGYNVITASNGREALDKVSKLNITVVLSDIKMPGLSGIDVLQMLTAERPDISVIMVTAVGDAQTAIEAMKMGAYDYVIKPFNRDDVILTVQRAIEKRILLKENEHHRLEVDKRLTEQADQLQQRFAELVETLAREHKLIYRLATEQRGGGKTLLSKLPKELQEPMSTVEEFSEALLKILRRGALRPE